MKALAKPPTPKRLAPSAPARSSRWWQRPDVLVCAAILASFFIIRPLGSYAVDDEWAYLKSLEHWAKEGRLVILQWNPMSLVAHVLWGGLFTSVLGFSFTAARLSALAMFIGLGLSVAGLLREMNISDRSAILALLALVFAPLCFFHAFLYVTDIPACTWTCAALLLLVKGLKSESTRGGWLLLAGATCGCVGFLVRQSGALVFLSLLVYLLIFDRPRLKTPLGILSGIILPTITIAGFQYWYVHVHGTTILYRHERSQILQALSHPQPLQLALYAFKYGIYIGLFCLPLLAGLPASFWKTLTRPRVICVSAVAGLCALMAGVLFWRYHILFPYLPNKITPFGILSPNEVLAGDRPVLWGKAVAWTLSLLLILALVSFVALALASSTRRWLPAEQPAVRLLTLLAVAQFAYLLLTAPIVFDRHLLLLLPSVILLVALWTRDLRLNVVPAGSVLAVFAFYSIATTHDVHAFSRAAFAAGRMLSERGVGVMQMDCGYAYDGWNTFELWQQERIPRARPTDAWWVRALMQGTDTRFVASLSPSIDESAYRDSLRPWSMPAPALRGYQVVATIPYQTWWPPAQRDLYILARESPTR